jgi:hypothetical protein
MSKSNQRHAFGSSEASWNGPAMTRNHREAKALRLFASFPKT